MTAARPLSALELLRSSSLPALVQAEIEQLILRGELSVGQRLNESELAVRFGTSRGPVREALRALEECRLVRAEKNRGVFVRDISVAEADEIYDVREVLDELIGQRVAAHATPPRVCRTAGGARGDGGSERSGDVKRYHALNLQVPRHARGPGRQLASGEIYRLLTKELLLFRLRGLQDGGGFAVSVSEHKRGGGGNRGRRRPRAGRLLRPMPPTAARRMHKAAAQLKR